MCSFTSLCRWVSSHILLLVAWPHSRHLIVWKWVSQHVPVSRVVRALTNHCSYLFLLAFFHQLLEPSRRRGPGRRARPGGHSRSHVDFSDGPHPLWWSLQGESPRTRILHGFSRLDSRQGAETGHHVELVGQNTVLLAYLHLDGGDFSFQLVERSLELENDFFWLPWQRHDETWTWSGSCVPDAWYCAFVQIVPRHSVI